MRIISRHSLAALLLMAGAVSVLFSSCNRMDNPEAGMGRLSLGVDINAASTKASLSADELLSSAVVNIYYADFSGLVRTYSYSEKPEVIYLPSGSYRVDVVAGEAAKQSPAAASWEQKSYFGSSPFEIEAGAETAVEVVAGVSNAVSKVAFSETIAENFAEGYSLTIGIGENTLVYDASKSGAEGYFILDGISEPEFAWTFTGTLSGSAFTKSGTISGLEGGKVYAMTFKYTVKDGFGTLDVLVDYDTENIEDVIVFEPVSTGLSASSVYEIWAGHATVHANVDEGEYDDPSKVAFAYATADGDWTTVAATRSGEGTYDAVLEGLSPETEYSYKLVIDGEDIGDALTFTTEAAPAIPNGSFEESSESASGNYTEFYSSEADAWWGSGNGSKGINGSADFGGFIICAPDTSEKVDGNQSACLTSTYALVKFAAGNLFSGYFAGLEGVKGGKVAFGRPFTGRPTALRVWLKYSTGKINRIGSQPEGETVTTDDYDTGRVQVALGTWDYRTYGGTRECPILVNTTDTSTFVDFATDASTLAHGDLQLVGDASDSYNSWVEYTIPIEYRNETEYPTYIVVSCASSKLGDYFTGCDSSKLWIDKMELLYE
ncbi:MAG: DUF4493 domain-containing protein [Bacteroidales bacterium]|nr:DUF4493 domain-containing protein [Bacteroidales bacterium]